MNRSLASSVVCSGNQSAAASHEPASDVTWRCPGQRLLPTAVFLSIVFLVIAGSGPAHARLEIPRDKDDVRLDCRLPPESDEVAAIVLRPEAILPARTVFLIDVPNVADTLHHAQQLRRTLYRQPPVESKPNQPYSNTPMILSWGPATFDFRRKLWNTAKGIDSELREDFQEVKHWEKLFPGQAFFAIVPQEGKPQPVFGFQQSTKGFPWIEHLVGKEGYENRTPINADLCHYENRDRGLQLLRWKSWVIGTYDAELAGEIQTELENRDHQEPSKPTDKDRLRHRRLFHRIAEGTEADQGYSVFVYADHHRLGKLLANQYDPTENQPTGNPFNQPSNPMAAGVLGLGVAVDLKDDEVRFRQFLPIAKPTPDSLRSLTTIDQLIDWEVQGLPPQTRELTLVNTIGSQANLYQLQSGLAKLWGFFNHRDPIYHLVRQIAGSGELPQGRTAVWADWTTNHPHATGGIQIEMKRLTRDRLEKDSGLEALFRKLANPLVESKLEEVPYQGQQVLQTQFAYNQRWLPIEMATDQRRLAIVTGLRNPQTAKQMNRREEAGAGPAGSPVFDAMRRREKPFDLAPWREAIVSPQGTLIAINVRLNHLPIYDLSRFLQSNHSLQLSRRVKPIQYGVLNDKTKTYDIAWANHWDTKDANLLDMIWLTARLHWFHGEWRLPQKLHYDLRTLVGVNRTENHSYQIKGVVYRPSKTRVEDE